MRRILAFLFLIALSGGAYCVGPPTPQAKTTEVSSAPSPASQIQIDLAKIENEKNAAREEANLAAQIRSADAAETQARWAGPSVVFNAISSIAVLIALYLTYRANKTSEAALEHTKESTRNATRAYVYVDTLKSNRALSSNGDLIGCSVSLVWKNFGSTPAIGARSSMFCCEWHSPYFPPWFPFPEMPSLWGPGSGEPNHIPQGGTIPVASFMVIPLDHVEEIAKGWRRVFVWGEVSYEDIYGGQHRTRFCYRSSGAGYEGGDKAKPIIQFNLYESNNCVDEQCALETSSRPAPPEQVQTELSRGGAVAWYMWMDGQRPTTYERAPDGTPLDNFERDYWGIKNTSDAHPF